MDLERFIDRSMHSRPVSMKRIVFQVDMMVSISMLWMHKSFSIGHLQREKKCGERNLSKKSVTKRCIFTTLGR